MPRLEVRQMQRSLQSAYDFLLFTVGEILGIDLFPWAFVLKELCSAGRKQRETLQAFVMGKIGEQLRFELRPIAPGNDGHSEDAEEVTQTLCHFVVKSRLAFGKRAVQVEDDQLFHGCSGIATSNKFTAPRGRKTHAPTTAGRSSTSPRTTACTSASCSSCPAPSMHTRTRGAPTTPTANGLFPRCRHNRKCSQSKTRSRNTGVVLSTTGALGPMARCEKSIQARAWSTCSARGCPVLASTRSQSYRRKVTSLFC